MALIISEIEGRRALEASLEALRKSGWQVTEDKLGIRKRYYFKTFTKVVVCIAIILILFQLPLTCKGFF